MSNTIRLTQLTSDRLPEIAERARAYYRQDDPLEYHHYPHVADAQGYFDQIVDDLNAQEVYVDELLGHVTIEFHDAAYHENHETLGFSSKEAYSAAIAGVELSRMGIVRRTIEQVGSGIMATHINGQPKTNTEKAVRLGDVGNAADTPLPFQKNLIKFAHDEVQMGRELPATFHDFCLRSQKFLGFYFTPPTVFTRADGSEVVLHELHKAANANLASLSRLDLRTVLKFTGLELRPELAHWLS